MSARAFFSMAEISQGPQPLGFVANDGKDTGVGASIAVKPEPTVASQGPQGEDKVAGGLWVEKRRAGEEREVLEEGQKRARLV